MYKQTVLSMFSFKLQSFSQRTITKEISLGRKLCFKVSASTALQMYCEEIL